MATITLRPNGTGFVDGWIPLSGESWQNINDVVADDSVTYTLGSSTFLPDFLCTIESNSIGASDTINSITIYFRVLCDFLPEIGSSNILPIYRENSTISYGSNYVNSPGLWGTFFETFTVRGSDSSAFSKSDIDSLQIGLISDQSTLADVLCTQLYVVVDYTPAGGGGGSPVVKPIFMMLETDD
jgi:hypothetical protein